MEYDTSCNKECAGILIKGDYFLCNSLTHRDDIVRFFRGLAAGRNLLTPRSNFEIAGTIQYHIVLYLI
jgi:hypothetical protein